MMGNAEGWGFDSLLGPLFLTELNNCSSEKSFGAYKTTWFSLPLSAHSAYEIKCRWASGRAVLCRAINTFPSSPLHYPRLSLVKRNPSEAKSEVPAFLSVRRYLSSLVPPPVWFQTALKLWNKRKSKQRKVLMRGFFGSRRDLLRKKIGVHRSPPEIM